jgi:hypothetical protein
MIEREFTPPTDLAINLTVPAPDRRSAGGLMVARCLRCSPRRSSTSIWAALADRRSGCGRSRRWRRAGSPQVRARFPDGGLVPAQLRHLESWRGPTKYSRNIKVAAVAARQGVIRGSGTCLVMAPPGSVRMGRIGRHRPLQAASASETRRYDRFVRPFPRPAYSEGRPPQLWSMSGLKTSVQWPLVAHSSRAEAAELGMRASEEWSEPVRKSRSQLAR